jgi:fructose-1,6-bisphosphatase
VGERDYYVRQFRDMKGAVMVDGMDGSSLMDYARICGALLAKGHARSTGATVLSGYLGKGDAADRAFARFARAYADQTEADHEALGKAVKSGRLPAEHGI